MPGYIFYDKTSGEILHVHREYYMDSEQTVEVEEERLLAELGELLPKGIDVGILTVEDVPQPRRGYRYYVDRRTAKLMKVEAPQTARER
jgi:hypothetical protein